MPLCLIIFKDTDKLDFEFNFYSSRSHLFFEQNYLSLLESYLSKL